MSNYEIIYHSRHSIVPHSYKDRPALGRGPELDARSERLSHRVEPRDVPNIHLRCDEAIVSI